MLLLTCDCPVPVLRVLRDRLLVSPVLGRPNFARENGDFSASKRKYVKGKEISLESCEQALRRRLQPPSPGNASCKFSIEFRKRVSIASQLSAVALQCVLCSVGQQPG
jgi:hypothetical protein